MNEHIHQWKRLEGIAGTRSFHVECVICGKRMLEIRPKVAPLTEWGVLYKPLDEIIRELEHQERDIDE